jgi:hypothetical protein
MEYGAGTVRLDLPPFNLTIPFQLMGFVPVRTVYTC